jgi:hypothetical protein
MPTEAITVYLLVFQLAAGAAETRPLLEWSAFGLILLITAVYLRRGMKQKRMPWPQVALSLLLYVCWAYNIGGPFRNTPGYEPAWGAVFLAIGVFGMPALYRGASR